MTIDSLLGLLRDLGGVEDGDVEVSSLFLCAFGGVPQTASSRVDNQATLAREAASSSPRNALVRRTRRSSASEHAVPSALGDISSWRLQDCGPVVVFPTSRRGG